MVQPLTGEQGYVRGQNCAGFNRETVGSLGLLTSFPLVGLEEYVSALHLHVSEPAGRQAAQETGEATVSEPEMTNALV